MYLWKGKDMKIFLTGDNHIGSTPLNCSRSKTKNLSYESLSLPILKSTPILIPNSADKTCLMKIIPSNRI